MTPRHTALYDANVLYPSLLRNLLMHLAVSGLGCVGHRYDKRAASYLGWLTVGAILLWL